MTDDRWRRVNDLFHLALDRPAGEVDAFLADACGDDRALSDEVRALLSAHAQAGQFLEDGAEAPADRMVSREIGQYRIERVLGRGGMGVVYLARDTRLGRAVALKSISPEFIHDVSRRERLRREARAAAGLTHSGIATVYALEEFGDDVFIASEYVAGETLRDELARGPATPARALETAIGVAGALAAAHDRGVIHRDLKPENIIRTPSGSIKILDFGLAQMRDAEADGPRLTDDGTVIGTPAYMSPEQIRREPADARTDLFSLGIVISELMSGANPFAGGSQASTIARILESDPAIPPPSTLESTSDRRLHDDLIAIVRTCLAKSPDGRFASAHTLLTALEHVRQGGHFRAAPAAGSPDAAIRWWKFHQAATCVVYAGLMYPLWLGRTEIDGRAGFALFLAGLVAAVTACVLRLHVWFAVSSLPDEFRAQAEGTRSSLRAAESAFVIILAGAGLWILDDNSVLAALLVAAAVGILLSFVFIEPATTRAAFRTWAGASAPAPPSHT